MKDRILHNPYTTIAGLVIIASAIAYMFVREDSTWTEAAVAFGVGGVFLGIKDPKFGSNGN